MKYYNETLKQCGQTRPVFFELNPILEIWVEFGWLGPQGWKMGPIGLGWPQIGFKLGFNPIMYLINLNKSQLNLIAGRVGPPGSKFLMSQVGPPGFKFRLSRVGLVRFIWPHQKKYHRYQSRQILIYYYIYLIASFGERT